jgi:hypothetical protein
MSFKVAPSLTERTSKVTNYRVLEEGGLGSLSLRKKYYEPSSLSQKIPEII